MTVQTTSLETDSLEGLRQRVLTLERKVEAGTDSNALSMVVFSGELDKLLAALVIATGAAACGMKASMFFTFWATAALKKPGRQGAEKSLVERLFGWMLPGGLHKQKLSKMDMAGLGRWMLKREMRKKGVADLGTLIEVAQELGVELHVCEMSMSLMGIRKDELIDYSDIKYCGVARFLEAASSAGTTLFI